jgi:hypothetical protein
MAQTTFAGKATEVAELTLTPHGVYEFEFRGVGINHPARSECGRFWISPDYYGFSIWHSGGGCIGWRRDFVLEDGTPVYMLVTQDATADLEEGQPIEIGVHRIDGGWVCWVQDDGAIEEFPPRDVSCEGWPGSEDRQPSGKAALDVVAGMPPQSEALVVPNEVGLLERFNVWAKAELGEDADAGSIAVAWRAFRGGVVSERSLWEGKFRNTVVAGSLTGN